MLTADSNNVVSNTIFLKDYMQQKGYQLSDSDADILIIDLTALCDSEEDIIKAVEGFLITHEHTRVVIVSGQNSSGDKILAELFSLGIRNFAPSRGDFVRIKQLLDICLSEKGMSYKEAAEYKDISETADKSEKKITEVNKITIGIAGAQGRVGCTHNAFIIANHLRKKGYSVAIVEMNGSGAMSLYRNSEKLNLIDNLFYTSRNTDIWPDADGKILKKIQEEKVYNFLILDFGSIREADMGIFNKCHVKIAIGNTQPWELDNFIHFWNLYDNEARANINFYLNFVEKESEKRQFNKIFRQVGYLKYSGDPYNTYEFPGLEGLLADYLPAEGKKKKRFSLFRGKK